MFDRKKRGETDTLIVMFHLTAYLLLQIMPKMLTPLKIKVGRVKEGRTFRDRCSNRQMGLSTNTFHIELVVAGVPNLYPRRTTNIKWKTLNMITLEQAKSDNINRMITITGDFYLVICSKLVV